MSKMYCFVGQSAPQGWEKVTFRKNGLSHSNRIIKEPAAAAAESLE